MKIEVGTVPWIEGRLSLPFRQFRTCRQVDNPVESAMKKYPNPATLFMTLMVWALAGALFGGLFSALYGLLLLSGLAAWQAGLLGTLIAAVTHSAFYSSMPVALAGSMAGVLGSVGTLMAVGNGVSLPLIAGLAAAVGLAAGALYAWLNQGGERPLAESLTGLLCGLVAGGILSLVLTLHGAPLAMGLMAASIVAGVGGLFQLTERFLVSRIVRWCPHLISAPLVAGVIAAVVGAGVWVMAGTTGLDPALSNGLEEVLGEIPSGLLGGLMGGAVTSILLEILGAHLEEHEQAV